MIGKILVCDDQEIVREVVAGFLHRKGYDVTKAKDGKECLELIKNQEFEAVFLDVKMPIVDGLTVMREITRLGIKTQVILMSGFDPHHEMTNMPEGNAKFLSKPFALESVIQILTLATKNTHNRVLVVDDQDMLRDMLKDYLSNKGYEILEAKNGLECVEFTKKHKFDAIFMDVRMPEMDGLSALEALREHGVKTPVFLMSGYGEVASVEDAIKRGAQNFLPKPFKLEKALEMLNPSDSNN
jgi:DNA-binding NtrC family response regulator